MSVYLRGTHWHYRFMISKKSFSGPCIGCENEKQAQAYEKQMRQNAASEVETLRKTEEDIRRNRTVAALVENYRKELSGGSVIALRDGYDLASAKPSKRAPRSSYGNLRRTYWNDFVAFMESKYPDIKELSAVRRTHCEAYVSRLEKKGRFVKESDYTMPHKKNGEPVHIKWSIDHISPKTIREIVCVCKWVFSRLEEDAGITRNPWNGVVLPAMEPVAREVFSMDELKLIWDGLQLDPFCKPLFVIAANSGMTEGDICTLKWSEIDFIGGMIRRIRRKTGQQIVLPLLPELANYLKNIPRFGEYVLPEHARRYLENQSNISYYVKQFLDRLGIQTQKKIPGRKAVSVKDLHSLRHIFCYRAKKAGIPESTIQRMVGHAVLEMTKHYADHDTEDDLRRQIQKLPALFVEGQGANQGEVEDRRKLAELIPSLPIEVVRRWLGELSQALPEP